MKHSIQKPLLLRPVIGLLVAFAATWALAADSTWTNSFGGVFNVGTNWSAGVPALANVATFNLGNTYTVTFTTSPTNATAGIEEGTVTFALAGQTYTLTSNLFVGLIAGETGRLTLLNGSTNSANIILGDDVGETGFLTVSSNATASAGGTILVGSAGTGTLNVQNGGEASANSSVLIGSSAAGLGTVTVTGADSRLSAGGALTVGNAGTGLMTVSSGGEVTSASAELGNVLGSEGAATITGSGSRWTMTGAFTVGDDGQGELSVLGGGFLQSGITSIGAQNDGVGEATISGAGSLWKTTGPLTVGAAGDGVILVSSGGRVESNGALFGNIAGSNAQATVTGARSVWTTTVGLTVGAAGVGTLSVLDGATMTTSGTTLGAVAGGDGALTVDGSGSNYNTAGNMLIGADGKGIVTVSNGGTLSLTSPTGRIEVATGGGVLDSLVVTGAGSTVSAPGGVFVSGSSSAAGGTGQLLIADGGTLNAASGTVKIWPVVMAGISLHGGTIHARNFERLGSFDFRDGLLHVDGGTYTNGAVFSPVTINGFDADHLPTLRLSNNANTAFISLVTVGGTRKGKLEILSGSILDPLGAIVAASAGSSGSVLVTGTNTVFSPGTLTIGQSGTGTLEISDGGTVSNSTVSIGANATGIGTIKVSGPAAWDIFGPADIGNAGKGTVEIVEGGFLLSNTATLGVAGANSNGTVNVVGAGSRWESGPIIVASGGKGTLSIENGGLVESENATLASGLGFATVNLDGAGSAWTVNGALKVGENGGATLNVSGGARLSSSQATLSVDVNAFSTTTISGADSVWTNSGSLVVGGTTSASGGAAGLIIRNGAILTTGTSTSDPIKIWIAGSLVLDGGTITARRFEQSGSFIFNDGLLNIDGGLFNPTSATAPFTLNGADADDLPTLRLASGGTTAGITTLTIGNSRHAALEITGGSQFRAGSAVIAALPGSSGHVSLDGGASLNLSGPLTVGGTPGAPGGQGTLTIGQGASVNLPTSVVSLRTDGMINLDGGTLQMEAFSALGGKFNFNAGTLSYSGGATLTDALLTTFLGAEHSLSAGRSLTGGSLTLNAPMAVDGGSFAPTVVNIGSVLQINAGTLASLSSSTIQPAGLLRLTGAGRADFSTLTNNGLVEMAADTATLAGGTVVNNGILSGRGRITAQLSNNIAGSVRAENGARLLFLGTSNNNAGRIEALSGGTIEFQQALNNNVNALITGRDGVLRFTGGLSNAGSLAFTSGIMDVFGDINNSGPASKIVVSGPGTATFYDDVVNNGQIQVSTGSTAVYFGDVSGGGSFPGGGTNFFEGDLRPGNSPAITHFGGDVQLGSTSRLQMELGGRETGSSYDQLNVEGALAMGGDLEVVLLDGFSPRFGDNFDLFDFGSLGGRFDSIRLPALPDPLTWDTSNLYTAGTIQAVPEPAGWLLAVAALAGALVVSQRRRRGAR